MNLDDFQSFQSLDPEGMLAHIDGLPDQLQFAWDLGKQNPRPAFSGLQAILIAGMGGSAIGADLLPGHITGRSFQDALLEHNPNSSLFDILEVIERRIIVEKLERCNWNQTDAAEQFRIPLSTLNQKIKRLNIEIRKKGRE